jgi:hypothetical protein
MKPIYCFLLINIMWLPSCKEHKKNYAEGVKIVMPTHTQIYRPFETDTSRRFLTDYSQFKIYTLINTSCATCLGKLKGWDKFKAENPDLSKVPIIPVCYSRDSFELLKYLFESNKIPSMHLPLVLDLKDSFIRLNRTLIRTGDFTALTDSEDRILVPGNPLENNNVKTRFLQAVRNAE